MAHGPAATIRPILARRSVVLQLSDQETAVITDSPAPLRHLLTELAAAGSTGALHVDGSPGGTLYLVEGRIAHAESPACPGVGERLVGSGRLTVATWESAYRAGRGAPQGGAPRGVRRGPGGRGGRGARAGGAPRLVDDGHLAPGELACRVLAAICEATQAILHTEEAPARFDAGERHWLGLVTQIELTAVSQESARRRPLTTPTVEMPIVGTPAGATPPAAEATPPETVPEPVVELRPAVLVDGPDVDPADGPWAGRPRPEGARRTTPNALPIRRGSGRAGNAGPRTDASQGRDEPDYATLKRIRQALNSMA
jgi:hypothetical protein